MDFDLELVRNCSSDTAILRFYGWDPYCISLGANQSFEEIDFNRATDDNIDIVKRPTGGRAILHARELTYSLIIGDAGYVGAKELYEKVSKSIVLGLKSFDPKLMDAELENIDPNFSDLLKNPSGSVCFASTAKSEIKFHGRKLVGSAQRKLGSRILQHGSILIGPQHKDLVNYLKVSYENKQSLKLDLLHKTIEIETIIQQPVDLKILQHNIVYGFEEFLGAAFLTESIKTSLN